RYSFLFVSPFYAGAAGARYAAWVGIVYFLDAGPVFSIEGVIWTAVGGRATLIGPFIGAFLVRGAEYFLSGALASWWQIIVGGLFVFVVLVMRDGIVGSIGNWLRKQRKGATLRQVVEESDQEAHDRQLDWSPEGPPSLEEPVR